MNKYAIILAAGKGTRMRDVNPNISKVSHTICGVPLVNHVINAIKPLNLDKIVTIVGHAGEHTKSLVEKESDVVWQTEQKGTGHAVKQVAPVLGNKEGTTLILCGDAPLIKTSTLKSLINYHNKNHNSITVLGAKVKNPFGYGRLVLNEDNQLLRIVEQKNCTFKEENINLVNTGVLCFDNQTLFKYLDKLTPNPLTHEYYLTDLIEMVRLDKGIVGVYDKCGPREMKGVNTPEQLLEAEKEMIRRQKIANSFKKI